MDIRNALREFITVHEVDNDSPYTINGYRTRVGAFLDWLEETHAVRDTDDLKLEHLRGWINHLQKTPSKRGKILGGVTIHQYGLCMIVFCHWLEHEGIIEKPISTRFKLPKLEQKFIPTFTPEDIDKILAACEEGDENRPRLRKAITARNRAIVTILVDTGIRRSELAGLRLVDVDRDLRVLVVHRKGNKWQQVPISREGFKVLHDYLVKHRPFLASQSGRTIARKDDPVFLTDKGDGLNATGVSSLWTRLRKRCGIADKKVSPHNCRRYMATSQLAMGRSPLDVQRQMGHTSLQMTNRYASLTVDQLQKSHEEYSPWRNQVARGKGDNERNGYWDE
jgi:site-specific recombinase XerD